MRWLDLYGNQISDLSPLASLTNLWFLDLRRCQIRDLSTLASLTKLATLYLGHNHISDVGPADEGQREGQAVSARQLEQSRGPEGGEQDHAQVGLPGDRRDEGDGREQERERAQGQLLGAGSSTDELEAEDEDPN